MVDTMMGAPNTAFADAVQMWRAAGGIQSMTWYRGATMTETTAFGVSIVGTGMGIIGVMGLTAFTRSSPRTASVWRRSRARLTNSCPGAAGRDAA